MGLAVLQSKRQVQLLTKVLNDEIDLIVSHDRLLLLLGLIVPDDEALRCHMSADCSAAYRRVELASRPGNPGAYRCQVCERILEVFDGSTEIAVGLPITHSTDRTGFKRWGDFLIWWATDRAATNYSACPNVTFPDQAACHVIAEPDFSHSESA